MIARPAPRIFISAGEPSGDLHGGGVVQALRARYPNALIEALGGPRMAAAGAVVRYPMEGLAAFGLVEVVTKLAAHVRLLRSLRALDMEPVLVGSHEWRDVLYAFLTWADQRLLSKGRA